MGEALRRAEATLADLPTRADLLAAAEDGAPWTAGELDALPAGPPRDELLRRAFVPLVNAGHADAGRAVAQAGRLWDAPLDAADPAQRDVMFCLAVLDVGMDPAGRPLGDPARGRGRFARVREGTAPGSGLYWAAVRGELQALDLLGASEDGAALVAVLAASGAGDVPDDVASRVQAPVSRAGAPASRAGAPVEAG